MELRELSFPGDPVVKNLPANAGDTGSIPGSERSPGVGNGNPLQYSCLENLIDRGAWPTTVHGVTKIWAQLSMHTHHPPLNVQVCGILQHPGVLGRCGFVELWCFTGYRLKRKDKGSVSLQQDADVTHVLFLMSQFTSYVSITNYCR